jgi:hypothetical protein
MKKKITLLLALLSLFNVPHLYTAQPSFDQPTSIFYEAAEGKLMISYTREGNKINLLSLDQKPFGEEASKLTLDTLLESAHHSRRDFSFLICKTPNNTQVIVLTDRNLYPICDVPQDFILLGKYQLYPGGKGTCCSSTFTIPPYRPTLLVQPVLYPIQVPKPYPVFTEVLRTVYITLGNNTSSQAPSPHTTPTPPHSPFSESMPSSSDSSALRVDRILQRSDADSAALIPLVSALTTSSPETRASLLPDSAVPKKNRDQRRKGKHAQLPATFELIKEEERDEEEEKRVAQEAAEHQAQQETLHALAAEEQQQKEATERALRAAQEAHAREQEKIQAEKAAEEAQLTRRRDEEEYRKAVKQKQTDQRDLQKKRDQEAAALLKKEQEDTRKAVLQEKEREAAERKKADGAQKAKLAQGKQRAAAAAAAKSSKMDADEALLAKTIASMTALRETVPQLPQPVAGEPSNFEHLFQLDASPQQALPQAIKNCLRDQDYEKLKRVAMDLGNSDSLEYTTSLSSLYINAKHLLSAAEIDKFMINAWMYANDPTVDKKTRARLSRLATSYSQKAVLK